MLFRSGDERDQTDSTPPSQGEVSIRQLSATTAGVKFAGFADEQTEIVKVRLNAGPRPTPPWDFLAEELLGAPESWNGELTVAPASGSLVFACAEAENSAGLSTAACSDLVWDSEAPEVRFHMLERELGRNLSSVPHRMQGACIQSPMFPALARSYIFGRQYR